MAITIDYPTVRSLLDWSLDTSSLPDATIQLDIYEGSAIDWVTGVVADPSINPEACNRAACYLTAYLLAPSMPNLTDERFFDREGYTREPVDIEALRAYLLAQAESYIGLANAVPATGVAPIPVIFRLARGGRGQ